MKNDNKVTNVATYIEAFDGVARERLELVRERLLAVAPQAKEIINYGIPTLQIDGKNLVHYAGYEHHIGFYGTPSGHQAFSDQLSQYKQGKGSVQFSHHEELPLDLIELITRYRIDELRSRSNHL